MLDEEDKRSVIVNLPLSPREKKLLDLLAEGACLSACALIRAVLQKHHFDEIRNFLKPVAEADIHGAVLNDYILVDHYLDRAFFYMSATPDPPDTLSRDGRSSKSTAPVLGVKDASRLLAEAFTGGELVPDRASRGDAVQYLRSRNVRVRESSLEAVIRRAKNRYYSSYLQVLRKAGEKGAPT